MVDLGLKLRCNQVPQPPGAHSGGHRNPSRHASTAASEHSAEEPTLKALRTAGSSMKDQDEWAYCRPESSRAEVMGSDGLGPTLEEEILAQVQQRRSQLPAQVCRHVSLQD